jgi:hypothetical protein
MATHKKNNLLSDNSDKPSSDKKSHYIDNDALYLEFVKWNEDRMMAESLGKEEPPIPRKIGEGLLKIANNFSSKHNWYNNASYREEMVSDAVINCIKYIRNFNTEKYKNPFSYFSQICYYSFLKTIEIEQDEDYVKHKSTLNSKLFQDIINGELDDEDLILDDFEYNMESVESFISTYEKKKFGKKLATDTIAGSGGKTKKMPDDIGMF